MRHYFIWKTISCSRGNESARLGEIQCTLIELGWISVKWDENVPYESKFIELAQLTGTNALHAWRVLIRWNALTPVLLRAIPGKWDEFLPISNQAYIYPTRVSYPG